MRAPLSRITTLLIAAIGGGCGGGDSGGGTGPGPGPGPSVLTTVEVTPATATLFTVAPDNTATLAVVAKDQAGKAMTGLGAPAFSSDNAAIASVADDGTITALAAGTAQITASLTAGGVTKTGTTAVTVQVAPANGTVVAPGLAYMPPSIDVQAGGTVSWTTFSIPHTVTFTTAGGPENIPEFQDASNSRTFPTHGNFGYHCLIHPEMVGVVRVH